MILKKEIVIVGGGLAGLTCAIHLLKCGHPVTLIEKSTYPHHKVCGEFISNEVRSYLAALDVDINSLKPSEISQFQISSIKGKVISSELPLGGFGISRYVLDSYLYQKAIDMGCEVINDAADHIEFLNDEFNIYTLQNGIIKASLVVGAFGKRSMLDQKLGRSFFKEKSPWLAVKAHYKGEIENEQVALHNFDGGYCGISRIENNLINVCYLSNYKKFKAHKSIEEFQQAVLSKNPLLKVFFNNSEMVFEQPITISQVSFAKKQSVEEHILMIGDTAGLIHPLCGNGMAMAIHSAKLCAESCDKYLNSDIKNRDQLESTYQKAWKSAFQKRLLMGRMLSKLLENGKLFNIMLYLLAKFPFLIKGIIKSTHGKPNI